MSKLWYLVRDQRLGRPVLDLLAPAVVLQHCDDLVPEHHSEQLPGVPQHGHGIDVRWWHGGVIWRWYGGGNGGSTKISMKSHSVVQETRDKEEEKTSETPRAPCGAVGSEAAQNCANGANDHNKNTSQVQEVVSILLGI